MMYGVHVYEVCTVSCVHEIIVLLYITQSRSKLKGDKPPGRVNTLRKSQQRTNERLHNTFQELEVSKRGENHTIKQPLRITCHLLNRYVLCTTYC